MAKQDINKILSKYRKKLGEKVDIDETEVSQSDIDSFSKEYLKFKKEILEDANSRYERWCNQAEKLIQFAPPKKDIKKIEEAISTAHLNITPNGSASLAVLTAFFLILIGIFVGILGFILTMSADAIPFSVFFWPLLFIISGLLALTYLAKYPMIIATKWRLKASNQMVLTILYIVIYMRHTPNLEHAIKFAADHIGPPLSLDLRKVFWDIETRKFSTIKESLDYYLESWRNYNLEFVTSFHLIEASLYEPTEGRRTELLEKSLSVILDGTYDKMLHYAQGLKSPITSLHMLGVILPILGLVIFPLAGSFLQGLIKWYHLAFIYNLILPVMVYFMGMNLLEKRPTGYGSSTTSEKVFTRKASTAKFMAFFIILFFLVLGLFPFIYHIADPTGAGDILISEKIGYFFDFVEGSDGNYYGPFGLGALAMSFFIPLGLALAFGLYYKSKTKGLVGKRAETKKLETEFASALFQLGNRIGDGVPAEAAFGNVAKTMSGTPSGRFFSIVDNNIRGLGMGIRDAIYDPKVGAIYEYPSPLIESSMEVLLESSKKGPKIASHSLLSISTYVEKIHRVNERLKDLMAEVISSMKSQIIFLTPVIAGIVVGISAMVVNIIVSLNQKVTEMSAGLGGAADLGAGTSGQLSTITQLFSIEGVIPGFFFQAVVGVYLFQITYVLTVLQNNIENGPDKLNEQYLLSKNLIRSTLLYIIIALVVSLAFSSLAGGVLSSTEF